MRRVRGGGGVGVLLRRRGRAVRRVRPPRAPRQQARRQAPPLLAAQPGAAVLVVGAAAAAAALRHLPGSARARITVIRSLLYAGAPLLRSRRLPKLDACSDRIALHGCDLSLQEKRGLLFCKEDRAILCRDCDVSVHTASELTMRHTRFLLTGVRLSAEPAACPSPPPPSEDENSSDSLYCSAGGAAPPPAPAPATSHGSDSSSISEYLTKTLPGWHVEDFLVDEAAAANIAVSADASYQVGCR